MAGNAASLGRQPNQPVRFVDFSLRAWRDDSKHIQVIAHASPVGSMRRPATVKLPRIVRGDFELGYLAPLARAAEIGRELSRILMPEPIYTMLLERVGCAAQRPDIGLRLRLCLDDELIDLPWECLYRKELPTGATHEGFLLADENLSMVREPPVVAPNYAVEDRARRVLFVGTLFDDPNTPDQWGVRSEFDGLVRATSKIRSRLALEFAQAADSGDVGRRLTEPLDIFHYAGHVEADSDPAYLLQLAKFIPPLGYTDAMRERAEWVRADRLAPLLARAGTRLAVFNACNSGCWPFSRPFMQSGLPALIGVQGLVSNEAALAFAASLYRALAVGISLDEALTYARLTVLELGMRLKANPDPKHPMLIGACDWLRFMAYMPSADAVLFPRPHRTETRREQGSIRTARADLVGDLYQRIMNLDGAGRGAVLSQFFRRQVFILGRFDPPHIGGIRSVERRLREKHDYAPLVFDFDKPDERNLTESVRTFAALSRFIIADISAPRCVPHELASIVPYYPSIPIVPIIQENEEPYAMHSDLHAYPWVLEPIAYRDAADLEVKLDTLIVPRAEARIRERALPTQAGTST